MAITHLFSWGMLKILSESEILAKQLDIQADVLKVGHHGSDSATTQAFLDKVNPKYAIISVVEKIMIMDTHIKQHLTN